MCAHAYRPYSCETFTAASTVGINTRCCNDTNTDGGTVVAAKHVLPVYLHTHYRVTIPTCMMAGPFLERVVVTAARAASPPCVLPVHFFIHAHEDTYIPTTGSLYLPA
eukprot:TRINITY_DN25999_c0_g1_i1.p1 TRINITY_DN25999_c0_g1~~TRINITY_DN25999_c0_g1_i1.p1  ORF type:complete len:108 (+),score=3.54 TRINITY_DN25999_c0_g1_i1:197-520(+)